MTGLHQDIISCRHCPRLRAYRQRNQQLYPEYWNGPVPASGVHRGLTIVGLAPGLHGANKTAQPFTGDASGELLFRCLNKLNIEDQVRITNVVKCAPPGNQPLASERKNCQKFLVREITEGNQPKVARVYFCLGRVAHEEMLKAFKVPLKAFPFGHGNTHEIYPGTWLVDSYHCSRYNVNTGRINESMFLSALHCAVNLAKLHHDKL